MTPRPATQHLAHPAWAAALVFLLTLAVFVPAISYDFVGYDDPLYVTELDWVKEGFTLDAFRKAWTERVAGNWHPLTMLSHLTDTTFFGLDPRGHHATSLVLHALNAALLFAVFHALFGGRWRPFIAALLFAFHPFNMDSAVWIAERKNLLSTFFWLTATWCYIRFAKRASLSALLGSVGLFGLGLMAKPMLVTFPFTLLMLDVWPLRRVDGIGSSHGPRWAGLVREKSVFFMMTLVFSLFTIVTQFPEGHAHTPNPQPLWARAFFTLQHYQMYLEKFIWPTGFSVLYPRIEMPVNLAATARAGSLLAIITFIALRTRRRAPALLFGWLWFLGTMFPVSGIVEIGQHSITDRYMYVPMIGLITALVWAWPVMTRRAAVFAGRAAGLAAVVACAVLTRAYLPHWQNSVTLFERAVVVTENNYVMLGNLGRQYILQFRNEEAIAVLERALAINPRHGDALNNLGLLHERRKEFDRAISLYERALAALPNYTVARVNLARALLAAGRPREALVHYEILIKATPGSPEVRENHQRARQLLGLRSGWIP